MSRNYTIEQIEYVRSIANNRSNEEITKMFNEKFNQNRTVDAIRNLKKRHGIKSNRKHLPNPNKGKKGLWGPNKGSFKKGRISERRADVGTEVVNSEGYIEVKVAQPNIWKLKHHLIWEQHYGKIPEGHKIMFADGDKTNFNIDNLVCVTDKQLLALNSNNLRFNDTELTKTAINLVDLNYKITDIMRKHNLSAAKN